MGERWLWCVASHAPRRHSPKCGCDAKQRVASIATAHFSQLSTSGATGAVTVLPLLLSSKHQKIKLKPRAFKRLLTFGTLPPAHTCHA